MSYIIAIDSEGTLQKSNGEIFTLTKKSIRKKVEENNIVVICIARLN